MLLAPRPRLVVHVIAAAQIVNTIGLHRAPLFDTALSLLLFRFMEQSSLVLTPSSSYRP